MPVLLLAAGCGGGDAGAADVVSLDTLPGGIPVVHNRPPADRFGADAWRIREDLRLGSVLGEGPETFGDIRGVAVDERGRIYVLDTQALEVRAFSPGGELLWSAGSEGEGPGEFLRPHGLTLGPEGRLWIPDHRAGRYSIWSTDGEPMQTRRTDFLIFGYLWHGSFDRAGHLVDRALIFRPGEENTRFLRRFDGEAGRVDTLPFPSRPEGWEPAYFNFERGSTSVPFGGRFLWRLDRRGHVWFGVSDRYRITKRALEGDTLRVLTGRLEPVKVTAAEREQAEKRVLDFRDRVGRGELDLSRIPDTKAPLHGLSFDSQDRLWVRLVPEREGISRFDVYDQRGRWQGSAVADFGVSEHRDALVRGDHLYAVVVDSLGVQYVVRGLIERP